jgi:hypothetical protein
LVDDPGDRGEEAEGGLELEEEDDGDNERRDEVDHALQMLITSARLLLHGVCLDGRVTVPQRRSCMAEYVILHRRNGTRTVAVDLPPPPVATLSGNSCVT